MKFCIAIHGGAGTILKEDMTPQLETAYLNGLNDALNAAYSLLEKGDSAVNAVKTAIKVLEDNILFNAGKGSVFTKKGVQEMDAAIMDGATLNAGCIAGIHNIRNPIELASEVMLHSNHVFLSGEGAIDFAIKQGFKLEPDEYFFSQFRYDQWKAIRDSDNYSLDHTNMHLDELMKDKKIGAVVVVQNKNDLIPQSILTDRDIVIELLAEGVDPKSVKVKDIATEEVFTVKESAGFQDTLKLMEEHGIRRIPLVNDENKLVGIISLDDLIIIMSEKLSQLTEVIKQQK